MVGGVEADAVVGDAVEAPPRTLQVQSTTRANIAAAAFSNHRGGGGGGALQLALLDRLGNLSINIRATTAAARTSTQSTTASGALPPPPQQQQQSSDWREIVYVEPNSPHLSHDVGASQGLLWSDDDSTLVWASELPQHGAGMVVEYNAAHGYSLYHRCATYTSLVAHAFFRGQNGGTGGGQRYVMVSGEHGGGRPPSTSLVDLNAPSAEPVALLPHAITGVVVRRNAVQFVAVVAEAVLLCDLRRRPNCVVARVALASLLPQQPLAAAACITGVAFSSDERRMTLNTNVGGGTVIVASVADGFNALAVRNVLIGYTNKQYFSRAHFIEHDRLVVCRSDEPVRGLCLWDIGGQPTANDGASLPVNTLTLTGDASGVRDCLVSGRCTDGAQAIAAFDWNCVYLLQCGRSDVATTPLNSVSASASGDTADVLDSSSTPVSSVRRQHWAVSIDSEDEGDEDVDDTAQALLRAMDPHDTVAGAETPSFNLDENLSNCESLRAADGQPYRTMDVYVCKTCMLASADSAAPDASVSSDATAAFMHAGICWFCTKACHRGHECVWIGVKTDHACDCGTERLADVRCMGVGHKPAHFSDNKYNHNFALRYCYCSAEETGTMLQCPACLDWFHETCVGDAQTSANASYFCEHCMKADTFAFLRAYTSAADVMQRAPLRGWILCPDWLAHLTQADRDRVHQLLPCLIEDGDESDRGRSTSDSAGGASANAGGGGGGHELGAHLADFLQATMRNIRANMAKNRSSVVTTHDVEAALSGISKRHL